MELVKDKFQENVRNALPHNCETEKNLASKVTSSIISGKLYVLINPLRTIFLPKLPMRVQLKMDEHDPGEAVTWL